MSRQVSALKSGSAAAVIAAVLVCGLTTIGAPEGSAPAAVEFPRGATAHIVAAPRTPLEERVTGRLAAYLEKVLGTPARRVKSLGEVPAGQPAVVLVNGEVPAPFAADAPSAPEGFALVTGRADGRSLAVAAGHDDRGLKRAVQRLMLRSEQQTKALAIPPLRLEERPWIPCREWTICPWSPGSVRGVFHNPDADPRLDMYRYDDRRLADYVEMFDGFGFSGAQLMETCYTYRVMGSIEAAQERQRKIAGFLRENGQEVTLWAWAAQFDGFGWVDPEVVYRPAPGVRALDDPRVRRTFDKYYDHYAELAPVIDRFIGHYYDPGSLAKPEDVFACMRLLESKLKAKNPEIRMGVDAWAADADYVLKLAENGFQDYLLLEMSFLEAFPPGRRERLHAEAAKAGLTLGMWGWYMTEYETDQLASMYVNSRLLKRYVTEMRDGAHRIHPVAYWSEMEAHHLNNIYSMYVLGQLLWNPDRDPAELLRELTDGLWGPENGPVVRRALELIEDARTGPGWETYWWTRPTHRVGTEDPARDLQRAEEALASLAAMKPDPAFVPKFPLPYPPSVFVELMIPHLRQIGLFAEFRVRVAAIREAARGGAPRPALEKMLAEAWRPVPEFSTWTGTFGSQELREQKRIVADLGREYGLAVKDPAWLRYLEADRALQVLRSRQRLSKSPIVFGPLTVNGEFYWPPAGCRDRFQKLIEDGVVTGVGEDRYQLTAWEQWAGR